MAVLLVEVAAVPSGEDEREVDFSQEWELLPEQTRDDTDAGWGARPRSRRERLSAEDQALLDERPPHW